MDNQHLNAPARSPINVAEPLYGAAADAIRDQLREPTDLNVALHVAPSDLPAPVTDLFAAIAESLNVPLPSTELADERAYHRLIERRAAHVRILLESLSSHPDVSIHRDAADVRTHIEQTPVTYTTFDTQKAQGEQQGEGQ